MVELRPEDSWPDRYIWQEMAVKRGIRLPLWRFPVTTGHMRRWLKKLGIEVTEYLDANNERNLKIFAQNNPTWPLRAWIALQLEWLEWREQKPVSFERIPRPPDKRRTRKKIVE